MQQSTVVHYAVVVQLFCTFILNKTINYYFGFLFLQTTLDDSPPLPKIMYAVS